MNLKKIQNAFFWNNSSPKIKHETLCNDYKAGGLKNVDIRSKITALQCSWIRRLYDNSFYEWKLIPLYQIEKSFGTSFTFHSNLLFRSNKINFYPSFYRQIILNWKKRLTMITEVPSCILPQYLWYNRIIQVDNFSVYFLKFSKKISTMFLNFLMTMDPLNNGINLRENTTYMKVFIFTGYN